MVELAAFLIFATGAAHSYLGERYLLRRLFRRPDLPRLFGGTAFTVGTLRFAWHLTTVAWWGFAALLVLAARGQLTIDRTLAVIASVAFVSAWFPIFFTRAKHLSWLVFLTVAGLLWFARG